MVNEIILMIGTKENSLLYVFNRLNNGLDMNLNIKTIALNQRAINFVDLSDSNFQNGILTNHR